MSQDNDVHDREPTREEVDRMPGLVLLEFGTEWWGFCRAIRPQLAAMLGEFPQVRHVNVEDGKGKPLGRSFRVKLWPTFVLLRGGQMVEQLVRPGPSEVRRALEAVTTGG